VENKWLLYKFSYRLTSVYFCILLFLLSGCQKDPEYRNISNLNDHLDKEIITIPDNYLPGVIIDFKKLNDSLFIFTDLAHRAIFRFNGSRNSIKQISQQGSGPGEYTTPTALYILNNKEFGFSDISSPNIKIIQKDGTLMDRYTHSEGGGSKWYFPVVCVLSRKKRSPCVGSGSKHAT